MCELFIVIVNIFNYIDNFKSTSKIHLKPTWRPQPGRSASDWFGVAQRSGPVVQSIFGPSLRISAPNG